MSMYVTPVQSWSPVHVYQRFERMNCLHLQVQSTVAYSFDNSIYGRGCISGRYVFDRRRKDSASIQVHVFYLHALSYAMDT